MSKKISAQCATIRKQLEQQTHFFDVYQQRCVDLMFSLTTSDPEEDGFAAVWDEMCDNFRKEADRYLDELAFAFTRLKRRLETTEETVSAEDKQQCADLFTEFDALKSEIKTHVLYVSDSKLAWHAAKNLLLVTAISHPSDTATKSDEEPDSIIKSSAEDDERAEIAAAEHAAFLARYKTLKRRGYLLRAAILEDNLWRNGLKIWKQQIQDLEQAQTPTSWHMHYIDKLKIQQRKLEQLLATQESTPTPGEKRDRKRDTEDDKDDGEAITASDFFETSVITAVAFFADTKEAVSSSDTPDFSGIPSLAEELAEFDELFDEDFDVEFKAEHYHDIQLCIAAVTGNEKLFEDMLLQHADINFTLPNGETPLSLAAAFGYRPIVMSLLANGACIYNNLGELPEKLIDNRYDKYFPKALFPLLNYASAISKETVLEKQVALLLENLAMELTPPRFIPTFTRNKFLSLSRELQHWAQDIADMSADAQQLYDYLQPRYVRLRVTETELSQTFDFILQHLLGARITRVPLVEFDTLLPHLAY